MKDNIITIPNPILRQKSQDISRLDSEVTKIYKDLKILLEQQNDPEGLGLSAPQIGLLKRIFVVKIGKTIRSFINPKIDQVSKEKITSIEGCLSVPLYYGEVTRPKEIDIFFQDEKGKKIKRHFKGITATVIQHETDHLNGILFIDYLKKQGSKLYKVIGKDKDGKEKLAEVKIE